MGARYPNTTPVTLVPDQPPGGKEELERRVGIYYGVTRCCLYEHSKEHVKDADSFDEGSHIIKHSMKHHPDEGRPEFIFSVIKNFRDCLSRKVAEAINFHYSIDELLNSKNTLPELWLRKICLRGRRDKRRRNWKSLKRRKDGKLSR